MDVVGDADEDPSNDDDTDPKNEMKGNTEKSNIPLIFGILGGILAVLAVGCAMFVLMKRNNGGDLENYNGSRTSPQTIYHQARKIKNPTTSHHPPVVTIAKTSAHPLVSTNIRSPVTLVPEGSTFGSNGSVNRMHRATANETRLETLYDASSHSSLASAVQREKIVNARPYPDLCESENISSETPKKMNIVLFTGDASSIASSSNFLSDDYASTDGGSYCTVESPANGLRQSRLTDVLDIDRQSYEF